VPEKSFLKKDDDQAKASITITPKPGQKLTTDEIIGIQRLVAAAIPEIQTSAVTILDNRGVALTKTSEQDQEGTSNMEGRLAIKQQTEEYLTKKIASVLDKTFGPGKAIVSVDVSLNHDSLKVTREDILPAPTKNGDPDGAVIRKKQNTTHRHKKKKASAEQNEETDDSNAGPVESTSEETEYVHGKKIEQLVSSPGAIKRISVGVIIPNNLDAAKIDMLSKVISMSVGLNAARGDALAVYPIDSFSAKQLPDQSTLAHVKIQEDQALSAAEKNPSRILKNSTMDKNINSYLVVAIVLLAVVFLCWIFLILRRKTARQHLTEKQREEVLKEIQIWLAQSGATETRNA
jgi:flagellar M-ring protein FliF